jgi:hypothetical protein
MSNETKPEGRDWRRNPDFAQTYANNVRFEQSAWDLRLLFGVLDQSEEPPTIVQQTAVNIPWAQAKHMLYFLYVNILAQEHLNGPILVPRGTNPPSIQSVLGNLAEDERGRAMLARIERLYSEIFQT